MFALQVWSFLRKKREELVLYSCPCSKITFHGFDAQIKPHFLKMFYGNTNMVKTFSRYCIAYCIVLPIVSLNIVLILASGREFVLS